MQQAHTVDPRNGDFTANALKVLERRYFLRDGDGHICENPEQLFLRVARAIASIESRFGLSESEIDDLTEIFKDLMLDRKFLPNSPTLMNAGKPKGQLSA